MAADKEKTNTKTFVFQLSTTWSIQKLTISYIKKGFANGGWDSLPKNLTFLHFKTIKLRKKITRKKEYNDAPSRSTFPHKSTSTHMQAHTYIHSQDTSDFQQYIILFLWKKGLLFYERFPQIQSFKYLIGNIWILKLSHYQKYKNIFFKRSITYSSDFSVIWTLIGWRANLCDAKKPNPKCRFF